MIPGVSFLNIAGMCHLPPVRSGTRVFLVPLGAYMFRKPQAGSVMFTVLLRGPSMASQTALDAGSRRRPGCGSREM